LSPPVAFIIFILVGLGIYLFGRKIAPRFNPVGGKTTPYACGEDIPMKKMQVSYRLFFHIALFFTIMHVAALMLATLPAGLIGILGILYLVVIALAIFTLVLRASEYIKERSSGSS
jgi:NADH:ubiquinone oxidoreductase subunit 3 (subunit A)